MSCQHFSLFTCVFTLFLSCHLKIQLLNTGEIGGGQNTSNHVKSTHADCIRFSVCESSANTGLPNSQLKFVMLLALSNDHTLTSAQCAGEYNHAQKQQDQV